MAALHQFVLFRVPNVAIRRLFSAEPDLVGEIEGYWPPPKLGKLQKADCLLD